MSYLNLIKNLDHKSKGERLDLIIQELDKMDVIYQKEHYGTGLNLIVDLGGPTNKIGVASHFDIVFDAGGANDNSSAIAVCLDVIKKWQAHDGEAPGIRVFFFDEEESGLKGSEAYVRKHGVKDMIGLINIEMVGMGDKFALWPVNAGTEGKLLETFELTAKDNNIPALRFDNIVINTADHLSFQRGGLKDSFTVTRISDRDLEVAQHYYKALEFDVDKNTLFEIITRSPLFQHYHQPTDTYEKLSEESILETSATIWQTILNARKL